MRKSFTFLLNPSRFMKISFINKLISCDRYSNRLLANNNSFVLNTNNAGDFTDASIGKIINYLSIQFYFNMLIL